MTPGVIIQADGEDVTNSFMDRLLEVSIQDSAGFHNDQLTIEIDDRTDEGFIKLPPDGTQYDVSLGYQDMPNQDVPAPLTFMGRFIQDEIEIEGGAKGRTFRINAHAVSELGTFKQQRTRSYHDTTLGKIVEECAERNGLEAVIAQGWESIPVQHLDQTNESDGAFLTRMYDLYGAVAKPINGKLLFGPPDGIRELQGDFDQDVVIDQYTVISYRYLSQGRGKFGKTKATHYNKDTATAETVDNSGERESSPSTSGEQVGVAHTDSETYSSEDDAQAAANSKKNSFAKSECSMHIVVIGDPYIMAGGTINLINFRPEIPTKWHVTKVTHKWTEKAFLSEISADTKFGEGLDKDGNPIGSGGDDDGREAPPSTSGDQVTQLGDPNDENPLPQKDEGAQVQINPIEESAKKYQIRKTDVDQAQEDDSLPPPPQEDETGTGGN